MAFEYEKGVSHAEFLQSEADGKFYLLEVACRVGGAYIANVLEHACGFNLWREWARLETATREKPYKPPKLRKEFAGICLALANTDEPDTSHYTDEEIVYRVKKPKHVGLIFRSSNASGSTNCSRPTPNGSPLTSSPSSPSRCDMTSNALSWSLSTMPRKLARRAFSSTI